MKSSQASRRRCWRISFFFFFAAMASAFASLGDNSDRIEDTYGDIVRRRLFDDGTVGILYHHDRYLYYVIFDHDVSISERYSYYEQRDLSEKEVAHFLKANAGRKLTWRAVTNRPGSAIRSFERSDGKAEAKVTKVDDRIMLTVKLRRVDR
jgi:hypothetical protein